MRPSFCFSLVLLLAMASSGYAQDKLVMYRTFGGAHFEYEKDTAVYQVTPKQVSQILFDHPQAYKEFKRARRQSTWSGILGFAGAGLIIIPTASAVIGGNPEWGFAAAGAALIGVSIPLGKSYRRNAQHAIDQFNERHAYHLQGPRLYVTGTQLKLVIKF
ncbi:MAG: hypothetical protein JNN04_12640 [Cyclobacteriaceae bacterium]|nr:hypothetical protein [Cyclobacteriaceae bacterium]